MQLSQREWIQLDEFIAAIHACGTSDILSDLLVNLGPKIIGVDVISWDEHDTTLDVKRGNTTAEYAETLEALWPHLATLMSTHPYIVMQQQHERFNPKKELVGTHDILSDRQVRELAIFHDIYREMAIVEQMSFHLYFAKDFGTLLTAGTHQKITPAARFKFQLLQKHLLIAGRRLIEHARLSDALERLSPNLSLGDFTGREKETLGYVLDGKSNAEIAIILGISVRTVEKHVASILRKSGAENRKVLLSQFSRR